MATHDEEERDLIDMNTADLRAMPLYRTAPERIGLAIGDELEDWNSEFHDCGEVTWYSDEPPVQVSIGYVRADLYDALRARVAELERNLDRELMCHAGCAVIAGCNSRESLKAASSGIHPDYMSASLQSCIDAAWREIYERERANKAETGLAIMAVCGYFSRMRGPDAMAKDAARYQFLRGIAYSGVSPRKELLWCLRGLYDTNGYSFDEAIDAAIAVIAAKAKGE